MRLGGRLAAGALAGVLGLTSLAGCEWQRVTEEGPTDGASSPGEKSTKKTKRKTGEVAVPITVVVDGGATLVLVPVRVNGRGPYQFILDTGASTSSIDERIVRTLRLPETGDTARVTGVTGSAVVPVVQVDRWTVGGQELRGDRLTVTDIGDRRIAGLLGSDELRRFGRVAVDYSRERLVLRDR